MVTRDLGPFDNTHYIKSALISNKIPKPISLCKTEVLLLNGILVFVIMCTGMNKGNILHWKSGI